MCGRALFHKKPWESTSVHQTSPWIGRPSPRAPAPTRPRRTAWRRRSLRSAEHSVGDGGVVHFKPLLDLAEPHRAGGDPPRPGSHVLDHVLFSHTASFGRKCTMSRQTASNAYRSRQLSSTPKRAEARPGAAAFSLPAKAQAARRVPHPTQSSANKLEGSRPCASITIVMPTST